MSELVIANKSELVDVADAIRSKTGKTAGMSLSEMPSAISGIDGAVTPTISVSSGGLIAATAGKKSATKQLDIQGAKTVTPSTSSQIAVAKDVYTTGAITVGAIPDSYIVDDEIGEQDWLIANIKMALEEKAASGGSSSSSGSLDSFISGEIEEITSYVDYIRMYCFYMTGITSADFPLATSISECAFSYCSRLTNVNIPLVESIDSNTFESCESLEAINLPSATYIGDGAFAYCSMLTDVNAPLVEFIGTYAFGLCPSLTTIDLPSVTEISLGAFEGCESLTSLILRSENMCYISEDSWILLGTPIEAGEGYIYVPDNLVNDYKEDAAWSVYADQIRPLSEYEEA